MLKASVHTDQLLEIYLEVAQSALNCRQPVVAATMLKAAYELTNSSQEATCTTLTRLAELLLLTKDPVKSEGVYNLAMSISKRSANPNLWVQARVCDGLAEVFAARLQVTKAIKSARKALSLMNEIKTIDPALLASRKRRLALLYLQAGRANQAVSLYQHVVSVP